VKPPERYRPIAPSNIIVARVRCDASIFYAATDCDAQTVIRDDAPCTATTLATRISVQIRQRRLVESIETVQRLLPARSDRTLGLAR